MIAMNMRGTFVELLLGIVVSTGLVTTSVIAADGLIPGYPPSVQGYDAREVAMLPSYCQYTQDFRKHVPGGNNEAQVKHWYATLGQTFNAMHHYCWGLMKTNRALLLAKNKQTRTFYLGAAIDEYNYVVKSAKPDFVLLPEILTKKAENLIRLGKGAFAIAELDRAIELNAAYWPPYATLSDYYKHAGNVEKAREVLERGLSAAPDARSLKRRLAELDAVKPRQTPSSPSRADGK